MEIITSTNAIVPEVLKEDNYERWSILMEHYLVAQDLWDVVQSSEIPEGGNEREWMKKNALALHAIGISCGREAFDQIKNIRSAKAAWDALALKLKPPPIIQDVTSDISEPHQERQTECQEKLQKLVCYESISDVKQFLRDNQEQIVSALKHAITCDRKKMARYLYRETPLDLLHGDSGFSLLERCITKGMFDIALDLLRHFPEWAFKHPLNSTPIILTLAETAPPFLSLNELGSWGRWIYECTRVKAFPIKPRSTPAGGVGIVQDKLRKWALPVLYKFHLVCVMIGLLCWMPCWLAVNEKVPTILFAFELLLFFVVPLLKLDLLCVLIGIPLFRLLVLSVKPILLLELLPVFILLLVVLPVILRKLGKELLRKLDKELSCNLDEEQSRKLDKKLSRKPELAPMLRIAAELLSILLRIPIGVPLLLFGVPISILISRKYLMPLRVPFFLLFLLFSMPLLIFVIQKYKLKLMDEYAHEVIRFICGSLSKLDKNQFVQSGAVEATYWAIENDIPEIVIELLKGPNGETLWSNTDPEDSRNLFAHAIAHRQEKVARFLYDEFGKKKNSNMVTATDEDQNNILHIAARLSPYSQLNHISGAALQLQSELHWFKSVEGVAPQFNKQKNKDDETPTEVFLKEHKNLVKEAEGWMKKVAESCTVVGALVITITFAAAFTVPGGNDQSTGFPIFLNTSSNTTMHTVAPSVAPSDEQFVVPFTVFAVSDAISLFAASSSVLAFMGILTSRYACQDFHISLPIKLIIGLSSLFLSIAAMMVAFCATLFIMLHDKEMIVIPIISLAAIPVTLFILLQSPLLVQIYGSTFRPDIFNRRRYWKYGKNVYSCFNRRWWFRKRRGWMFAMLCALVLFYFISFIIFVINLE